MLTLYYKPSCPYCQKVLAITHELATPIDLKDTSSEESILNELIEKGGKRQVPFLIDSDQSVTMYESDAIVGYLREHYAVSDE